MKRFVTISTRLLALLAIEGLVLGASLLPARGEGEVELRRNQVVKSVERVKPALVSVRTTQIVNQRFFDQDEFVIRTEPTEVDGGLGSGVVFHPLGFVITNAHVISRASNLYVHAPGKEAGPGRKAVPFAVDPTNDLAILRILPEEGAKTQEVFPYLPLGRSDDLMLGETVIAVGNPYKLGLSVSTGVVAGLNRSLALGKRKFDDFIQVDAAINPGNSGGPLLDVTGRWIGVTTAIYGRMMGAEGIGFAIPTDRVKRLVGTAFKRRVLTGEWLGLEEVEGVAGAAMVKRVFPRGPGGPAGLKPGDVLMSVNGQFTPTLYDYSMAVLAVPADSAVRLGIMREGREVPGGAVVQLLPVPVDALSLEHLGFVASDVPDYEAGVLVRSLRPGGPAAKVGLKEGDVIQALGPGSSLWKIGNTDDLLVFLQYVNAGDLVQLRAKREDPTGPRPVRFMDGSLTAE